MGEEAVKNVFSGWTDADVLAHNKRVAKKDQVLPVTIPATETMPATPKKRLRQSFKKINKLESEAFSWLSYKLGSDMLFTQAITFQIANGCKYTPDIVFFTEIGNMFAYECKGKHMWDDSIVKLKVAAKQFQKIQFFMMWKDRGIWQEQRILS